MVGWLGGGGTAPVIIGYIAQGKGLSFAIAAASIIYIMAAVLLLTGILFFVRRDAARMQTEVVVAQTR